MAVRSIVLVEGCYGTVIEDGVGIDVDYGVEIHYSQNTTVKNIKVRRSVSANVRNKFPQLDGVTDEMINEAVIAVSRSSEPEDTIKATSLGRFLAAQSFVDWAQLALALLGSLRA